MKTRTTIATMVAVGLVLAAGGSTAQATPVTAGLVLHLDADAITGKSDGDLLSQWDDQSGNSNHATQGTSANQPKYETGELGGKPVVRFDGGNDWMDLPGGMFSLGDVTAFVVGNVNAAASTKHPFLAGGGSGSNQRFYMQRNTASLGGEFHFAIADKNPAVSSNVDTSHHIFTLRDDDSQTVNVEAWIDGDSKGTSNTAKPGASVTVDLGAASPGQSWAQWLSGDIAEVLLYNRPLNDTELNDVGLYLQDKYALSGAYTAPPGAMTVSQDSAAPATDVIISQTGNAHSTPFRWNQPAGTDRNPRDTGQSFLPSADFTLDKITVNVSSLASTAYDGQPVTLELFKLTDGSDPWPDSMEAIGKGNLPSGMKTSFEGGDTYLTFDIGDVALSAGQQYGFLLMHDVPQASGDNMLLGAQANSAYTDGIGITREYRGTGSDVYKAMTVWTTSSQPADLEFYIQQAAAPIPEPATMAAVGLAVAGLGGYVRRRRRS